MAVARRVRLYSIPRTSRACGILVLAMTLALLIGVNDPARACALGQDAGGTIGVTDATPVLRAAIFTSSSPANSGDAACCADALHAGSADCVSSPCSACAPTLAGGSSAIARHADGCSHPLLNDARLIPANSDAEFHPPRRSV